ncbi:lipopolysaccharide heptosyltransferase I [Thermodesulfatator indicus DSM 15286]|uniref:Lipopolysaccharide heptosyltransferase 1 n=1 Tax=Thermodesulfatator indicus (strain DSM 15286 / JCM 11887 / CIR29812) TaxID=667014 RepID=F8A950_THEID|nr:lipopolysaccharide heptosyltransferase I [Thermodesulfatator indicus]AEH45178.1 lipopolysaccharide heptosyltransferase I [Thermodesulfatator indicus DSM 15286]
MKILIVKLSSLGDIVHALPVLSALKKNGAEVDWIVEEEFSRLLEGHPYIDRLLVWPRKRILRELRQKNFANLYLWKNLIKELRTKHYDVVIDLQGLLKSGIIVGLARGRCKLGFANHREGSPFFYNFKLPPYDPDEHAIWRYLKVLKYMGQPIEKIEFSFPPLPPLKPLREKFNLPTNYVVFIPCTRWSTKYWTKRGWVKLSETFESHGLLPVFVGSKNDQDYVNSLINGSHGVSLCGKTDLQELASVLAGAKLVVSVDTGPLHLAAALKTPVIALFGPTAPWRTGPLGDKHQVLYKKLNCSPCFLKECENKTCMKNITPEEVWTAAQKII